MTSGGDRIESAILKAKAAGRPAIAAFLTAGFPSQDSFPDLLGAASAAADVLEVGLPFSDPMADGVTIQRASRTALLNGTTVAWTLGSLRACIPSLSPPVVLMSYVNPLLAYGVARLARDAADAGVSGFIVPDLPIEEQSLLRPHLRSAGLALVQMVTPATPGPRLASIAALSDGFVYAVALLGTTGGSIGALPQAAIYLERVRAATEHAILAGFGVGTSADVAALVPPADGVVVGSALIAAIERGEHPARFLERLIASPQRAAEARP
jgi:tryptophan synthase alpha chain